MHRVTMHFLRHSTPLRDACQDELSADSGSGCPVSSRVHEGVAHFMRWDDPYTRSSSPGPGPDDPEPQQRVYSTEDVSTPASRIPSKGRRPVSCSLVLTPRVNSR